MANFPVTSSSSFSLDDLSQVFSVYKLSNADNIDVDDITRGLVSRYIKAAYDPGIDISDNSSQRVIYRPVFQEVIDISDDSISHMRTPQNAESEIDVSTHSYIEVDYKNIGVDPNIFNLSDISDGLVSRALTKTFKNASLQVGNTEEIIYTCPAQTTTNVMSISLANLIASPVIVNVIVYKLGIDPIYILEAYLMEEKESLVINKHYGNNIILEEDDEIRVSTSSPVSTDVFISLLEQSL